MSFVSDTIFNSQSGIVKIWVPNYSSPDNKPSAYTDCIKGILEDDPQIQMSNNFVPLSTGLILGKV